MVAGNRDLVLFNHWQVCKFFFYIFYVLLSFASLLICGLRSKKTFIKKRQHCTYCMLICTWLHAYFTTTVEENSYGKAIGGYVWLILHTYITHVNSYFPTTQQIDWNYGNTLYALLLKQWIWDRAVVKLEHMAHVVVRYLHIDLRGILKVIVFACWFGTMEGNLSDYKHRQFLQSDSINELFLCFGLNVKVIVIIRVTKILLPCIWQHRMWNWILIINFDCCYSPAINSNEEWSTKSLRWKDKYKVLLGIIRLRS